MMRSFTICTPHQALQRLSHKGCGTLGVAHMGNTEMHSFLMGKLKGESLLGRTKGRWEDYIRTDLKGTRCEDVEWNDVPLSRDK